MKNPELQGHQGFYIFKISGDVNILNYYKRYKV